MDGRTDEDVMTLDLPDMDWEIICDIYALRYQHEGTGYPPCQGDPANWVALRANCCAQSPCSRLVCDFCKSIYQKWVARQASIVCSSCKQETGGFLEFLPLNKRSS